MAKSADEARAAATAPGAAAKAAAAAAAAATAAKTKAAAAAKAAATKAANDKAAAAAKKKEDAYIASFGKLTSGSSSPVNVTPGVFGINGPTWGQLAGDPDVVDVSDNGSGSGNGAGNGSGKGNGSGNGTPVEITDATRDAFAMLQDLFASYGLEGLSGEIADYMKQGLTATEALIKLKTNPSGAYAKRFAGNFTRVKNGLNAISEAEYIDLEKSYANTLKAYGLGNMVSGNREDNYKKFAEYIAGDISAVEFKDRIDTVVTRVQNADPTVKATLKQFYPELNDADLIGYFLNPKDNLPKLQEKVTASEIGAAAKYNNLATDVTAATDLARYGVDQKAAREGYSTIAGVLPVATKLGDIYNETGVKYAQAGGEAEVFKGNQDAATKRKRLASMERAAFSGNSGVGQSSLSKSTQGIL